MWANLARVIWVDCYWILGWWLVSPTAHESRCACRDPMLPGTDEIKALMDQTLEALEKAGLTDMKAEVTRRVCECPAHMVTEYTELQLGQWRWRYKPIVELLLIEITSIARHPHWTNEVRRQQVKWVLHMAGL